VASGVKTYFQKIFAPPLQIWRGKTSNLLQIIEDRC